MLRVVVLMIAAVAGTGLVLLTASAMLDRRLANWEIGLAFTGVVIALGFWQVLEIRRQYARRRLWQLRDSALW